MIGIGHMSLLLGITIVLGLLVCRREAEPQFEKAGENTQPPLHEMRRTGRNSKIMRWKGGGPE